MSAPHTPNPAQSEEKSNASLNFPQLQPPSISDLAGLDDLLQSQSRGLRLQDFVAVARASLQANKVANPCSDSVRIIMVRPESNLRKGTVRSRQTSVEEMLGADPRSTSARHMYTIRKFGSAADATHHCKAGIAQALIDSFFAFMPMYSWVLYSYGLICQRLIFGGAEVGLPLLVTRNMLHIRHEKRSAQQAIGPSCT